MKIKDLFDLYKEFIEENPENTQIFIDSGMVNNFQKLDYGFFPLGSGILTEHSENEIAEIEEGGTLVLGNDFGTLSYVENKCIENREVNNKTIDNLKLLKGLDVENAFFSNLFLGLRNDENHDGTTNTKLVVKRKQEYIDLCFKFLKIQLDFIKPKIVLCLGVSVGKSLARHCKIFLNFSQKDLPLTRMYEDGLDKKYIVDTNDEFYGDRKFVLIPHPSFAHINWKNDIKTKIEDVLRS